MTQSNADPVLVDLEEQVHRSDTLVKAGWMRLKEETERTTPCWVVARYVGVGEESLRDVDGYNLSCEDDVDDVKVIMVEADPVVKYA